MFRKLYNLVWEYNAPDHFSDFMHQEMRTMKRGVIVIVGSFITLVTTIMILGLIYGN